MSRSIRIGVIGCGGNGRGHLKRLAAHPEAEIVALADPSRKMLALTRQQVPGVAGAATYAGHRQMLKDTRLDAVVIATPHTQHYGQVIDALDAGCHVLCEKPLTTSVRDTKRVIARAKRRRRSVVVGFQRRFMAMRRFVRSFIRDKAFGKVQFVQAFCSQGWLTGTRGTWRQNPGLSGGGQLNDTGAHIIDMIFWTIPARPVEVAAMIHNRGTRVDIDSAISFRFANGALGDLTIVGSGPTNVFWEDMTITGSGNRAIFLRQDTLTASTGGQMVEYKSFGRDGSKDSHFIDVIRRRVRNEAPPKDFLPVIAFTEACWKSAKQGGKPVKIRY